MAREVSFRALKSCDSEHGLAAVTNAVAWQMIHSSMAVDVAVVAGVAGLWPDHPHPPRQVASPTHVTSPTLSAACSSNRRMGAPKYVATSCWSGCSVTLQETLKLLPESLKRSGAKSCRM